MHIVKSRIGSRLRAMINFGPIIATVPTNRPNFYNKYQMRLRKAQETKQPLISTAVPTITGEEMLTISMKNRHSRLHNPRHSRICSMIFRRSINNLNSSSWSPGWPIDPDWPWLQLPTSMRMWMGMGMILEMGSRIMRCPWVTIIKLKLVHPKRRIKVKGK